MSNYGYGHPPPEGYQPLPAFSYQPNHPYNASPLHQGNASANSLPMGAPNLAQGVYQHNQNTIPGLGLGFSNVGGGWQQAWPTAPHDALLANVQPAHATQKTPNDPHFATDLENPVSANPVDDVMEEGELSEGEMEDLYEPMEPQGGRMAPQEATDKNQGFAQQDTNGTAAKSGYPPVAYHNPASDARDRSGSYSPHLSPQEVRSSGQEKSLPRGEDLQESAWKQPKTAINTLQENAHQLELNHFTPPPVSEEVLVADAKQRAREAILSLVPLKVRYQQYIDEGIDQTIVANLFEDLGLDMTALPMAESITLDVSQDNASSKQHEALQSEESEVDSRSTSTSEKPKNSSEERKDRIARLLAAKGTKPTAAPSTNIQKATSVPTGPAAQHKPKNQQGAQSEKSKLIQKKMEALKKAREENAKKAAELKQNGAPVADSTEISAPSAGTVVSNNLPIQEVSPTAHDAGHAHSETTTLDKDAPPIPGLFLSSTPLSPPVGAQRKRPVAADLNDAAPTFAKRPFSQAREARPFLIDVSDDEDAEMDIDSPEQRPSSIHRPTTPNQRTSSFRDHPALSDHGIHHGISSPSAVATPNGSSSQGNGMYDLESMNKKIEDMKRKIAEAEARKKVKQSENSTPSLPASKVGSKEGSVDTPATTTPPIRQEISEPAREDARGNIIAMPSPIASGILPKPSKIRGSNQTSRPTMRARAASERLPLVEAQRKGRLEHLKNLQFEIARIEKEIEDSLAEEERLRQEAMELEADHAQQQNGSESEASSVEYGSPEAPVETSGETTELASAGVSPEETGPEHNSEAPEVLQPADGTTPDTNADAPNLQDASQQNQSINSDLPDTEPPSRDIDEDVDQANDHDSPSESTAEQDVAMDMDGDDEDDEDESSDGYEPTQQGVDLPTQSSPDEQARESYSSPSSHDNSASEEQVDTDPHGATAILSSTEQQVTTETGAEGKPDREVEPPAAADDAQQLDRSSFVPYETPLQYFHAYRFHPKFKDSVAGGLRSLTYSNKIDVNREVCPDQLTGGACPRGDQCEYQHFESMKAPDDQILLQLGGYGSYEGQREQQYIEGLRELLTNFRAQKIKDFQTISDGIVEYRARFHGDKTKVLPLGNVSL